MRQKHGWSKRFAENPSHKKLERNRRAAAAQFPQSGQLMTFKPVFQVVFRTSRLPAVVGSDII